MPYLSPPLGFQVETALDDADSTGVTQELLRQGFSGPRFGMLPGERDAAVRGFEAQLFVFRGVFYM